MAKKKTLLIIDSNALIHRAYHALPPLTNKKGELLNAVYGFLLVFFKAIKDLQPSFIVATFDLPHLTFRHKKFKEYKAKRLKTPEELRDQILKVKDILRAFNLPIFEKKGYEADDIIGTIGRKASKKKASLSTIILTGDLDVLQLIDKHIRVYTLRKGMKDVVIYERKAVRERYGIEPEQLIDFKALKGDSSDNIPGVLGIGEKTATGLIQTFGSLEKLYKELENKKGKEIKPKLREVLLRSKKQAFLCKELVRIKTNVPLAFDLRSCLWGNYDQEEVVKILKSLDFYSLIDRLPSLGKEGTEDRQQKLANF